MCGSGVLLGGGGEKDVGGFVFWLGGFFWFFVVLVFLQLSAFHVSFVTQQLPKLY